MLRGEATIMYWLNILTTVNSRVKQRCCCEDPDWFVQDFQKCIQIQLLIVTVLKIHCLYNIKLKKNTFHTGLSTLK
jgi:hypothetical protein